MQHLKSSITDADFGAYCRTPIKKRSGKIDVLKKASFRDLKEGFNHDVVICGKVIAIVLNAEIIP